MNFVGNDEESKPWKRFLNFCVRAKGGGYNERFLVYLFGRYQFICNQVACLTVVAHRVWPDVLLGDRRKLVA